MDIHTAVQDYQTATASMGGHKEGGREGGEGKEGHGTLLERAVVMADGASKEEEEEEGERGEWGGHTLQRAHREADHYQSLEDLKSVRKPSGMIPTCHTLSWKQGIHISKHSSCILTKEGEGPMG